MPSPGPKLPNNGLEQRLRCVDAQLHVTVSSLDFQSAFQDLASSRSSEDGQAPSTFKMVDNFLKAKSCAKVPISIKPGTGENMVHQSRKEQKIAPDQMCSATARLLDLQTLLELPLAILGIRLEEAQSTDQGDYLWPNTANVAAIQVVRIPRNRSNTFTVAATPLSCEDFARTVWDFMQPEKDVFVIIHIKVVSSQAGPSVPKTLEPVLNVVRGTPPTPRNYAFKNNITPRTCVITGNLDIVHGAHIIQTTLNYELVDAVLQLLFGVDSPRPDFSDRPALFLFHPDVILEKKMDDPRNGICLSPTLHTTFNCRKTIWILRQRCYILGPPATYEELTGFDPPCPSVFKARKIQNDDDSRALWEEQLLHEAKLVPRECPDLSSSQECLLHLSALLSFFTLFMSKREAMKDMLEAFKCESEEGRSLSADEQARANKRQRPNEKGTGSKGCAHGDIGTRAAEGLAGGSSSRVRDQGQPQDSSTGEFYRRRPPSPPLSNPPSNKSSPSKQASIDDDDVAAPDRMKVSSALTPVNCDDDTKTGLNPDLDSNSEAESEWDEDEEIRRKLLHNDTLALSFMKYTLTFGPGQLCD
ncbi:hypothetical protein OC846_006541 [Tilletia horrida]|uniref:HNH nuclease domain-containing protein n=1 Tax=Tilletia horrida TaxID=155126 RepID=A0AAN6GNG7_9BASI|nr:hypothetical protein OC846_006541 [Tilletia horrida]